MHGRLVMLFLELSEAQGRRCQVGSGGREELAETMLVLVSKKRRMTVRSLLVNRDISSHPQVNLASTKVTHHEHLSIRLNTDINVHKILILLFYTVHKIYCGQTLVSIASITSQDRGGGGGGGDGSACIELYSSKPNQVRK